MRFDIKPNIGALPISFGMSKAEVHSLLGSPESARTTWDKSGTAEFWLRSSVNVGYNSEGIVYHVGFHPGDFELSFRGSAIWSPNDHSDPNPVLLRFDPAPVERLGFLVFSRLGVTTTGFHDDDESQQALTVFAPGTWDVQLLKATVPDINRYR